ncbi:MULTISPECIES: methionine ABC transporter permease [unclassified Brevibacterium]|uniref:methionine ABC transporter permease n=1 Tax=unclassified Brevibacterium TaxID=2614124 RepID=UPI0010C7DDE6|nr:MULTISPECIES: methionine ABC transporter permease [Actinomycetes]MCK1803932.1 ABC transporter permease [Brevibacterium sp. R8603A2]MCX0277414.1 ABC transporter permease [Nocardia zapadnayensis]QCP04776.1 ABC transporter permease [Brevibacterium sp. CS2]
MDTDWPTLLPVLLQSVQETLVMVTATIVLSGIAGLIIGAALYASRPGNLFEQPVVFGILNVIVNIVRPIPFIIFITAIGPLTLLVVGTTIGTAAAILPMTLMASVVIGRVVEQNLVAVDPGIVEASRAAGAGRLRTLFSIVLPEALAPLILGYTFMLIAIVDMSAMAGVVGGGGLGNFAIMYGYQQFDWNVTLVTVTVIIVMVQVAQLVGNWVSQLILRR